MKFIKVYGLSTEIYAGDGISFLNLRFENDVELYGTQTVHISGKFQTEFENDVELYGTQTHHIVIISRNMFENDVELYGTQTPQSPVALDARLRMM